MIYKYSVPIIPGTYIKTYVARIRGEHPRYRFNRRFLYRSMNTVNGAHWYFYEIGSSGVFEISIKRYKNGSRELIYRRRKWFVYYRKSIYDIDYSDVLFCIFNLKMQRKKRLFKRPAA